MLNFAGWSRINPSYNNSMMIHIGIRWNANEKTSISAGYFSQLERDDQFYIASLNQDFLSAGITFSVMRNLRLSATVLDSHILSGDQVDSIYGEQGQRFNQTQLMAGTSVLLN